MAQTTQLKRCPTCGQPAPLDAKFCQSCGHGYSTVFNQPSPPPTPSHQPNFQYSPTVARRRPVSAANIVAFVFLGLFAFCGGTCALGSRMLRTEKARLAGTWNATGTSSVPTIVFNMDGTGSCDGIGSFVWAGEANRELWITPTYPDPIDPNGYKAGTMQVWRTRFDDDGKTLRVEFPHGDHSEYKKQ